MIKDPIHQQYSTTLNNYISDNNTSKYIKQKLTKLTEGTDKFQNIAGYFNIPLIIDRTGRQKKKIYYFLEIFNYSKNVWLSKGFFLNHVLITSNIF